MVAPGGAIEPLAPAEAVIVQVSSSPTWKSLNPLTPVACVLVAVRVAVPVLVQFGESYFRTWKFEVLAPPSTSDGSKWNVTSELPNELAGALLSE